MEKLNNTELKKCTGGGLSFGACLGIIAGITFIIGVIDGYIRPLPCR